MSNYLHEVVVSAVLSYLRNNKSCDYDELLDSVNLQTQLELRREELKAVVVPMIASGKLKYYTGLTIGLA